MQSGPRTERSRWRNAVPDAHERSGWRSQWDTRAEQQRRWKRRVGVGVVLVVALFALGVCLASVILPDEVPSSGQVGIGPQPPASSGSPPSSASPVAPQPSPSNTADAVPVEPRAVTLRAADLPSGYQVLRQGLATFSPAVAPGSTSSWDVVFAPAPNRAADNLLVESLVAVLPDGAAAASALDTMAKAEQTANAVEQASVPGLGDRQTIWIEKAPDRPAYGIVRVTWQYRNVLAQVSVLGPIDPAQPSQAIQLAMVEQNRISAPAVLRST